MNAETRRILLEALIILCLGMIIGLSVNFRLVQQTLREGSVPAAAPVRSTAGPTAYPSPVGLAELRELLQQPGTVLVDARAEALYRRGHLAGARSLPLGALPERLPAFRRRVPKDALIITYCSGHGCPDSLDLATRLLTAGYRRVRVFTGGYPAWRDAGLPVKGTAP